MIARAAVTMGIGNKSGDNLTVTSYKLVGWFVARTIKAEDVASSLVRDANIDTSAMLLEWVETWMSNP